MNESLLNSEQASPLCYVPPHFLGEYIILGNLLKLNGKYFAHFVPRQGFEVAKCQRPNELRS